MTGSPRLIRGPSRIRPLSPLRHRDRDVRGRLRHLRAKTEAWVLSAANQACDPAQSVAIEGDRDLWLRSSAANRARAQLPLGRQPRFPAAKVSWGNACRLLQAPTGWYATRLADAQLRNDGDRATFRSNQEVAATHFLTPSCSSRRQAVAVPGIYSRCGFFHGCLNARRARPRVRRGGRRFGQNRFTGNPTRLLGN